MSGRWSDITPRLANPIARGKDAPRETGARMPISPPVFFWKIMLFLHKNMQTFSKIKISSFYIVFFVLLFFGGLTLFVSTADARTLNANTATAPAAAPATGGGGGDGNDINLGGFDWSKGNPLFWLIIGIQGVFAMFLNAGINLLEQFIDSNLVSSILKNPAITETWSAVRDVCNLAFILTLLFSAFATILHIEKYHIKNILLKVAIMALLINFSLPIARFVVDLGNVPMYYLAQVLFGDASGQVGSQIADKSNIICAIVPWYAKRCNMDANQYWDEQESGIMILGSTVLLFLFAITIFVIAILFVIRTVALAILLIFSPIGFAGLAVPALNKYANDWWENLTKYVMFGPVMLFMLAVSIKMMDVAGNAGIRQVENLAGSTLSGLAGVISLISIPIVILWAGLAVATKASIWGADTVTKGAMKWGKKIAYAPVKWTGIPGGIKKSAEYSARKGYGLGKYRIGGSESREAREAWVGGLTSKGWKGAKNASVDNRRKRIAEIEEDNKKTRESESSMRMHMRQGSIEERIANARSIADRGGIRDATTLTEAIEATKYSPEDLSYVLQKADKSAIRGLSGEQLEGIQGIITGFSENKRELLKVSGVSETDIPREQARLQEQLDIRVRMDGNVLAYINSKRSALQQESRPEEKTKLQESIQNALSGLNGESLAGQNDAFFSDEEVAKHFAKMAGSLSPADSARLQQFYNRSNVKQRDALNQALKQLKNSGAIAFETLEEIQKDAEKRQKEKPKKKVEITGDVQ